MCSLATLKLRTTSTKGKTIIIQRVIKPTRPGFGRLVALSDNKELWEKTVEVKRVVVDFKSASKFGANYEVVLTSNFENLEYTCKIEENDQWKQIRPYTCKTNGRDIMVNFTVYYYVPKFSLSLLLLGDVVFKSTFLVNNDVISPMTTPNSFDPHPPQHKPYTPVNPPHNHHFSTNHPPYGTGTQQYHDTPNFPPGFLPPNTMLNTPPGIPPNLPHPPIHAPANAFPPHLMPPHISPPGVPPDAFHPPMNQPPYQPPNISFPLPPPQNLEDTAPKQNSLPQSLSLSISLVNFQRCKITNFQSLVEKELLKLQISPTFTISDSSSTDIAFFMKKAISQANYDDTEQSLKDVKTRGISSVMLVLFTPSGEGYSFYGTEPPPSYPSGIKLDSPNESRKVFWLRFNEDNTISEIAENTSTLKEIASFISANWK